MCIFPVNLQAADPKAKQKDALKKDARFCLNAALGRISARLSEAVSSRSAQFLVMSNPNDSDAVLFFVNTL